jgi:hypothetical protein
MGLLQPLKNHFCSVRKYFSLVDILKTLMKYKVRKPIKTRLMPGWLQSFVLSSLKQPLRRRGNMIPGGGGTYVIGKGDHQLLAPLSLVSPAASQK